MLFKDYIEYFYELKENAAKNGDAAQKVIAKLFLNSLYGKFGTKTLRTSSI